MNRDDLAEFRKLATKDRDIVRASDGGWIGVYSALAMCLDHIGDVTKKVEAQATRIQQLEDELESHAWRTSPATAQAQIEQQAQKIEELHNQVARWKQDAQWAANTLIQWTEYAGVNTVLPDDEVRARKILDGTV